MKYCKKCLQPDTRPGIVFDENQICYACRFEEEKKKTDWGSRLQQLNDIAAWAIEESKKRNVDYDCVIGVSGGKDSTFQAVYAKEKLGLNPLLVNCTPFNLSEIGQRNIDNLMQKGFDIIKLSANPLIEKELIKDSFYKYGNIARPSEYKLWASAYSIADKFDIPLIIQGENSALTLGTAAKQKQGYDAFDVVNLNTLQGCNARDLLCNRVKLRQLSMYQIPDIQNMKRKNTKAIYLQYFTKEWSQVGNADFAIARGMSMRDDDLHNLGRYRRATALDDDGMIVNQMLKYYKLGFGFATDEACYDIREGRLTREDALWYVKEYDGKCGQHYIDCFCKSIDIKESEFWNIVDGFVNQSLFSKKISSGAWIPTFEVGVDYDEESNGSR